MTAELSCSRLIAVLGRLGSDFAGERDAAALVASKMLREAGVTWADVIALPGRTADLPAPRQRRQRTAKPPWQEMAARCRHNSELLTAWERQFVVTIRGQTTLSRKQWAILARMSAKVTKAAA